MIVLIKVLLEKPDIDEDFENEDYKHYIKKPYLMSIAERKFYDLLKGIVGESYHIIPQVQFSKIVEVNKYEPKKMKYLSMIDRKSVDFVLFDKKDFSPYLVIELDESSHLLPIAEKKDAFKNDVLKRVGIKIVRIKTSYNYNIEEVRKALNLNEKSSRHIFLIDEDQFILDTYKPLLEKEGYIVTTLQKDDKDTIAEIIAVQPDLIIANTSRGDDPLRFLKEVKVITELKNIPFVILSGIDEKDLEKEAIENFAIDYLIKSKLTPYEVIETVSVSLKTLS